MEVITFPALHDFAACLVLYWAAQHCALHCGRDRLIFSGQLTEGPSSVTPSLQCGYLQLKECIS